MKRLLAYLFIVLGLGLVFSVNGNAKEIFCVDKSFSSIKKINSYPSSTFNKSIRSVIMTSYNKNCPENMKKISLKKYKKLSSRYRLLQRQYKKKTYYCINEFKSKSWPLQNFTSIIDCASGYRSVSANEYASFIKQKKLSQTQEVAEKEIELQISAIAYVNENYSSHAPKSFYIKDRAIIKKNDNSFKIFFKKVYDKALNKCRNNKSFGSCRITAVKYINLDEPDKYQVLSNQSGISKNIKLSWDGIEADNVRIVEADNVRIVKKEPSQTQGVAKLKDIDITNTAWILDSRLFVLFLKNGKCKINERGLDVIIRNISYEGAWENYCKYKKHSDNRVELAYGNETNPRKYYLAFFENKFIGSRAEFGLKGFKEVLNGKKPRGVYVQGVKKELTATQIAKLPKKEPSQTQEVVKKVSIKLTKNEVNNLFASVSNCWSIPLGLPYGKDLSVKIKVKFNKNGSISRTELLDHAKINKKGNAHLKVLAESALRAIKLCQPLRLPKGKYELWKEIVFNFDVNDMLNDTESEQTKIAKNNLLNKSIETQIAKAEPTGIWKVEPTIKPEDKPTEVAETTQEEFKPENKDIDNDAPIIEIAEAITVNDTSYILEGRVTDKADKIFVEIDGQPVPVKKGKFKVKRYSPVDEQIKIVAIDQWGNKSKPKLVNITIKLEETILADKLEPLNPSNIRNKSSNNKVALIIGIENYAEAPKANYANLDAKYFFDYARRAFGVKKQNINLLVNEDATVVKTDKALSLWLKSKIKKNKSDLIIFFAGHGLASSDGKELYLLPQDGNPDRLERTALSRTDLFKEIINLNPKSVTMFLDTCYSGVSRDEQMLLASARPIRIIADEQEGIPDNFTIFSASKLDQISSGLKEVNHGIFSYFLMKGLEGNADSNEDKKITNGELLAYMDENVSQKAAEQGREQNPSLAGDPDKVLMSYR